MILPCVTNIYSTIKLFRVVTDYKNLIGFLTIKELN